MTHGFGRPAMLNQPLAQAWQLNACRFCGGTTRIRLLAQTMKSMGCVTIQCMTALQRDVSMHDWPSTFARVSQAELTSIERASIPLATDEDDGRQQGWSSLR